MADGGRRGGKEGGRGRLAREPGARRHEGHIFIHVGEGASRHRSVWGRHPWEGQGDRIGRGTMSGAR